MEEELICILNDIRKERGISIAQLAGDCGIGVITLTHFFALARKRDTEPIGKAVARGLGLPVHSHTTCAGAIAAYYKEMLYLTREEKELLEKWRKLNQKKRRLLTELAASMAEEG